MEKRWLEKEIILRVRERLSLFCIPIFIIIFLLDIVAFFVNTDLGFIKISNLFIFLNICLFFSLLFIYFGHKVIGKKKKIKIYINYLLGEKCFIKNRIKILKKEVRLLTKSNPLEVEPYFGINLLYSDISKSISDLMAVLENAPSQFSDKVYSKLIENAYSKLSSACHYLENTVDECLIMPEKNLFFQASKEEQKDLLTTFSREIADAQQELVKRAEAHKQKTRNKLEKRIVDGKTEIKMFNYKLNLLSYLNLT